MGNSTYITFSHAGKVLNAAGLILPIIQFLGAREDFVKVTKYGAPVREWEDRRGEHLPEYELLRQRMTSADASELVLGDGLIAVDWFDKEDDLGTLCLRKIWENVSHDLLNDHFPNNANVKIGEHDIFGSVRNDVEEVSFGQPFLSVSLWGYRCPKDIVAYREQVLALPSVERIRSGLEGIIHGAVSCEIYMHL